LGFSELIADCAAFIATDNFLSPDDRYISSIDDDLSIMTMMSFGFVAVKLYHGLQQQQHPVLPLTSTAVTTEPEPN